MTDQQAAQQPRHVTYLPTQRVTQARRWGRGWDRKTFKPDDSRWVSEEEWTTVIAVAITESPARLDVHYVTVYGTRIDSMRLVYGPPDGCPADEIEETEPDPYYYEIRELVASDSNDGQWWRIV